MWSTEKFKQEIGSSLPEAELRDLWFFSSHYTWRHHKGILTEKFKQILRDLKEFGTLEPWKKRKFLKTMESLRRRKYEK